MITNGEITEIFCAKDEFSKKNMPLLSSEGKLRRRRAASMSDSEIMTILIMFHFGTFDNFKHYYLHFIKLNLNLPVLLLTERGRWAGVTVLNCILYAMIAERL